MYMLFSTNGSLKELAENDENSVKERKVIMPEVKFSSHVNGVMEEKANRGNVNVASVQQTLAVQPEVSLWTSWGTWLWWEGWGCPRGRDARIRIHIKETHGNTARIKSAKVKTWKTDLSLERNVAVCQGMEKMFTLYCKLCDEKKIKHCSNHSFFVVVQTIFDKFITMKTLIPCVLNYSIWNTDEFYDSLISLYVYLIVRVFSVFDRDLKITFHMFCVSLHHHQRFRGIHLCSLLVPCSVGHCLLLVQALPLTTPYFSGHTYT